MCDPTNLPSCTYPPGMTSQQMTSLMQETFPPTGGVLVPGFNTNTKDTRLSNQAFIWSYCTQNDSVNGSVCRDGLVTACQNYTLSDTGNSYIRQLCGCYLPDDQYTTSSRECSSACTGQDTIKYFSSDTSLPSRCSSGVCVIDNITLQITGSTPGPLNFYQICPACGPVPCRCIISDINLLATDSRMGGINFQQECPGGAICYATDENNNPLEVDCQTYFDMFNTEVNTTAQQQTQSKNVFYAILVVAIVLFLLFIASVIAFFYEPPNIAIQKA